MRPFGEIYRRPSKASLCLRLQRGGRRAGLGADELETGALERGARARRALMSTRALGDDGSP